jgi:thiamine transport system permease protein
VARALARRRFPGRGLLITLLGAPFILPVIVAVMGFWRLRPQRAGECRAWQAAGPAGGVIYGWQGVILAHVFFNLPLAVRMILQGWQAIPAERFRLAPRWFHPRRHRAPSGTPDAARGAARRAGWRCFWSA